MHVCLPIIDTMENPRVINTDDSSLKELAMREMEGATNWAFLYVVSNSLQSDCEIEVMGGFGKSDEQFASEAWTEVQSLEEAVEVFKRLWGERDEWIKKYLESSRRRHYFD